MRGYGELMADAATVGWDDAKSLLELIEKIGANKIAAFFAEPIIGAGGGVSAAGGVSGGGA